MARVFRCSTATGSLPRRCGNSEQAAACGDSAAKAASRSMERTTNQQSALAQTASCSSLIVRTVSRPDFFFQMVARPAPTLRWRRAAQLLYHILEVATQTGQRSWLAPADATISLDSISIGKCQVQVGSGISGGPNSPPVNENLGRCSQHNPNSYQATTLGIRHINDSSLYQLSKVNEIRAGVAMVRFCFPQVVFSIESTIDFSASMAFPSRAKMWVASLSQS